MILVSRLGDGAPTRPAKRGKIQHVRDFHEWVPLLKAGDDQAWQDFVRVFSRFVPIVSSRLGLSATEREEVLQEMVLTAFKSIRNLRDPSGLGSWTYTIARRAAISQWRAKRRHQASDLDDPSNLERVASDGVPIDEILAGWEEGKKLHEAVATLHPNCRRLVEGLFLAEPRLSYREISEKHGMPMGSIGPTVARCLETLRRAWKSVSKGG